ncbi:MAG: Clp protease N-terminal domain-containing protein, partial [Spirulinaceae cyanobacterium]
MQPNNPNQFTEKAYGAISRTPEIAKSNNHQKIESEHLFKALLEQKGLANSIFNRAEVSLVKLEAKTDAFIASQPKVANVSESVYLGQSLDSLLDRAEKYRTQFD